MSMYKLRRFAAGGVLLVLLSILGCGGDFKDSTSDESSDSANESSAGHNHMGWWCTEHGIPESDCSMCSSEAAQKFKASGDWCEEHNRAESQCFHCDPKRADKFARLYVAKFGEQPPKPTE